MSHSKMNCGHIALFEKLVENFKDVYCNSLKWEQQMYFLYILCVKM